MEAGSPSLGEARCIGRWAVTAVTMGLSTKSLGFAAGAAACISLVLLLPAQAQFWDWGGRPQRQQQQNYNPFGGWFEQRPYQRDRERDRDRGDRDREAPARSDVAPGPAQK